MQQMRQQTTQQHAQVRNAPRAAPRAAPGIRGNQARLRQISQRIQAKLEIGALNDPLEHEADAVADKIMRMPASPLSPVQPSQKRYSHDEAAHMLQTKAADLPEGRPKGGSGNVHEVLRSPGVPLDGHARSFMEPGFGWGLSQVRVHVDSGAAHAATEMRAKAFTYGHHIVFGSGEYAPATTEGKRLLAHELTHVGQLRSDRILRQPQPDPSAPAAPSGVKVFPMRNTRLGAAPISAWRDGELIRVQLPVYVLGNSDFREQTKTLPADTFTASGVALRPDETVHVHLYELPHWYSPNITGSTDGDIETELVATGEQMLKVANASTTATMLNIGLTVVDAASLFLPTGKLVSAVGRPLRTGLAAAVIGTADVAPTAFTQTASHVATTLVDESATQTIGTATTHAVQSAAVQGSEQAAAPVVSSIIPAAASTGLSSTATQGATSAVVNQTGSAVVQALTPNPAHSRVTPTPASPDDAAVNAAFSPTAEQSTATPYQTTQRLMRGNAGERLATDALAAQGHTIIMSKPSIMGTNQGGIDIVSMLNRKVYLIDNKALSRSGNISSVSALTTNFAQNLAAVQSEIASSVAGAPAGSAQRQMLQSALDAIASGNNVKAVTNANIMVPDSSVLTGVTQTLQSQGIQFINVM